MADPVAGLERLLQEVRAATLGGAYDRLPGLAKRQARLVDALEAAAGTGKAGEAAAMRRLRRAAAENAPLLEAALAGLRAARRPNGGVSGTGSGNVYDRGGRRQSLEAGATGRDLRR